MASLNKVMIIGNLGKDPEVKEVNGKLVANITIATNEGYKKADGTKVEHTEWHSVELWDNLAKLAQQYLKKGNPVYVEGKLFTQSWEKDNVKHYATKIRALSMQLLGAKVQGQEEETEEVA